MPATIISFQLTGDYQKDVRAAKEAIVSICEELEERYAQEVKTSYQTGKSIDLTVRPSKQQQYIVKGGTTRPLRAKVQN